LTSSDAYFGLYTLKYIESCRYVILNSVYQVGRIKKLDLKGLGSTWFKSFESYCSTAFKPQM